MSSCGPNPGRACHQQGYPVVVLSYYFYFPNTFFKLIHGTCLIIHIYFSNTFPVLFKYIPLHSWLFPCNFMVPGKYFSYTFILPSKLFSYIVKLLSLYTPGTFPILSLYFLITVFLDTFLVLTLYFLRFFDYI